MAKQLTYEPFRAWLAGLPRQDRSIMVAEIEERVGKLGKSFAKKAANWNPWHNHPITHAWLLAGYVKVGLSLPDGPLELKYDPKAAAAEYEERGPHTKRH